MRIVVYSTSRRVHVHFHLSLTHLRPHRIISLLIHLALLYKKCLFAPRSRIHRLSYPSPVSPYIKRQPMYIYNLVKITMGGCERVRVVRSESYNAAKCLPSAGMSSLSRLVGSTDQATLSYYMYVCNNSNEMRKTRATS